MSTKKNTKPAPKSTPPKNEKAAKLAKSEAERAAAELADTKPNPIVGPPAVIILPPPPTPSVRLPATPKPMAPPTVIIPPAPSPKPPTEAERLTKRVAELEGAIHELIKSGVVDFTKLHNVLQGK